ncbi:all trans-polyprenyl-diphosphate synthase PDSS1-like [Anopheles merus]|uniref:All trans-polyprenyl-diphosphate synthase PDSS1 n=1 Tax=Anopheles merus TaxID=30066 RepID=A0A2C9H5R7_ANOME|nr:all trans-polyprenyl-diphosphate synthase PDSS1-like [Anopheles merus]XP_041761997.1 all trans-polyprenyl-diphosphate synthase PDSS1-like [Anopheles merus]XP_041762005.1 all trans-polyprenyl-diphosphate synthase PDSS1-like [Anopheles merus]XP_041762014.1 all trans-polyprenyl-diphosphate synthase PDSS1-like [Anopheles merus]XP_041762024.1 all trans-polyprenyl-diphosphate synthase PDSS1-like [Anopheles merus]XP_041762032.1 all trans-polyprenyl-diphosphate synthase PDSS1-like [Anopheles merus]
MACLSSSNRACVRVVQEKLCQLLAVAKGPLGQQQQQQRDLSLPASGPVVNVGGDGGGGGGGHRAALLSAGSGGTPLVAHSVSGPIKRSFYTGRGNFIQPAAALAPARAGARVPVGTGALFELNQKCSATANLHPCMRGYSSVHTQQPAGPIREYNIDPYILLEDELKYIFEDIRQEISRATNHQELNKIAVYYFDGQGKAFRPMVAILMAKALNYHMHNENSDVMNAQRQIAMISEMIHTASLVHDDVIDQSFARRGKPSVNVLWNHKKVTQAGDYILAVASMLLARLKHDEVTHILSQVLTDLVQGEFMQLGSKETENERFAHYFTKTYRKTASLIANSLKAVAVLSGADEQMAELSFQYGRNLGLAFQFVDDLLDFVSSSEAMGKPAAADLKLGLATAPVLFACEKFPELNPMILRRFREPGDVERAYELVHQSQGLEQTRFLARKHCIEALRLASQISESPYQKGLIVVGDFVLNRMK